MIWFEMYEKDIEMSFQKWIFVWNWNDVMTFLTGNECALPNTFHAIGDEYGGGDQSCQKEYHSEDGIDIKLRNHYVEMQWKKNEIPTKIKRRKLTSLWHRVQRILENRLQMMNKRVSWNWSVLLPALWAIHSQPLTFEQIHRMLHVIYAPKRRQPVDLTYPIALESLGYQTIHCVHHDCCPKYPWLIR